MKWLIVSFLLFITTVHAFNGPVTEILPLKKRFEIVTSDQKLSSESAQNLIGHLSLALLSLDYNLVESSRKHLADSEREARKLLASKIRETSELPGLKFNKFSYGLEKISRDVYVPVIYSEDVNQEFIDHSFGKGEKLEIKNTSIVQSTMKLNFNITISHMVKARAELDKGNTSAGKTILETIFAEAIVSEQELNDPVLAVWSNIILARQFMDRGEFKKARFTLGKAKEGLRHLEKKEILSTYEEEATELHNEIDSLAKGLNEKSPGLLFKTKERTKLWIRKIKDWF